MAQARRAATGSSSYSVYYPMNIPQLLCGLTHLVLQFLLRIREQTSGLAWGLDHFLALSWYEHT